MFAPSKSNTMSKAQLKVIDHMKSGCTVCLNQYGFYFLLPPSKYGAKCLLPKTAEILLAADLFKEIPVSNSAYKMEWTLK